MGPGQVNELIQYGFYGMISFIGWYAVGALRKLTSSVDELNKHVAVLLAVRESQEKLNLKTDERITRLETKE